MRINSQGYLERNTAKGIFRNWWLASRGINLGNLYMPPHLHGKRFRLKIELIDDE